MPLGVAARSSGFMAGSMYRRNTHMYGGGTEARIAIVIAVSLSATTSCRISVS